MYMTGSHLSGRRGEEYIMNKEQKWVVETAAGTRYADGPNARTARYSYGIFEKHMRPGSVLELGPAVGVVTELILKKHSDVTVVEGAPRFCEILKEKFPTIEVVNALFEDYSPRRTYENIIVGHVLEHVEEPVAILSKIKDWLSPAGRVLAASPNARSLHRQAAVIMGLLREEGGLNESDVKQGHRRVYDHKSFRADFLAAGLQIEAFGGYWLKPLSNSQIEAHWTEQMIAAFMHLGERYPEIAAEIYVVATK
jgi:2-polyprenyl-3-methyl-5-hydroxy-6-metoxy-1,4-benzoquinol methylase